MKTNSTWDPSSNRTADSRRFLLILSVVLVMTGLLFSCAGGGNAGGTPEWLTSYPSDTGFYVGIGGSSTGNLVEDREVATAAARADLAAQISIQVKSELDIASSAGSDGSFSESVRQTINESVEQNLQSVETVDVWISPDDGAWVYVRLSKAVWAAIVKKEIADMTLRANTALQPVAAGTMTEAEEMAALGRTRVSLMASPWGPKVKDEVFGTNGFLTEAVDGAIASRGAGLLVQISVFPAQVKYGEDVTISGTVRSGFGRQTGTYPLVLNLPDEASVSLTTDPDGSFSIIRPSGYLGLNMVQMTVVPDLIAWGIPSRSFPITDATTELYVMTVPVSFTVSSEEVPYLYALTGAVSDWFTDLELPVDIRNSGAVDYEIDFTWRVYDYPRSDALANAPYISEVGAVITFRRGGNVVSVSEVESFKDGGLDWNQAHDRAGRALLKIMSEDPGLRAHLIEIMD